MPKTISVPTRCTLCPRRCGADRAAGRTGFCGAGATLKAARAALHHWEEPCISGTRGSGTVFFSGCTLKCCFCQNYPISAEGLGKEITVEHLAETDGNCILKLCTSHLDHIIKSSCLNCQFSL